ALAALKVIAGEVNPSGKLAETFPMRYEDLPICGCYPADRVCEYREGLFIGYRYTETVGADVLFPFGYGLSYTTFSYANIQADNHNASFDITNTGKVAGSEIAQVYCANKQSKVLRPAKALVGFAKVHLNPGETKRVTVEFCERAFQYYNVNTSRYESEGGEWTLEVCANIRDVRLSATVHVDGTGAAIPASASASSMPKNLMNVTDREFERMLGRSVPMRTSDRERSLLQINDPIDALVHARNPLARLIIKFILRKREKSIRDGKPNLNLFFTTNMPFRAIAKMMNGMVSMDMAQSLLTVANSRRGRGFGKLIVGYFTRPSIKKVQEAERSSGKPMENIRA
ncbi:MAG: fibronectin type III-like domain-contianing protein, partial [Oscillospiraceae bacterium]|nr:fibronectin type III-like domain-contianing protein [Oscillospiraceae bacterium]